MYEIQKKRCQPGHRLETDSASLEESTTVEKVVVVLKKCVKSFLFDVGTAFVKRVGANLLTELAL